MQHAINQVSQIRTYNSVAPETKSACYFCLSKTPIKGIIIDPENDENGIEIKLEEERCLNKYYSFFIKNREYFTNNFQHKGFEYLTTPVGIPNIYFGFDKRILEMRLEELLIKDLYEDEDKYKSLQTEEVSLGLDGIIIIYNK